MIYEKGAVVEEGHHSRLLMVYSAAEDNRSKLDERCLTVRRSALDGKMMHHGNQSCRKNPSNLNIFRWPGRATMRVLEGGREDTLELV